MYSIRLLFFVMFCVLIVTILTVSISSSISRSSNIAIKGRLFFKHHHRRRCPSPQLNTHYKLFLFVLSMLFQTSLLFFLVILSLFLMTILFHCSCPITALIIFVSLPLRPFSFTFCASANNLARCFLRAPPPSLSSSFLSSSFCDCYSCFILINPFLSLKKKKITSLSRQHNRL